MIKWSEVPTVVGVAFTIFAVAFGLIALGVPTALHHWLIADKCAVLSPIAQ